MQTKNIRSLQRIETVLLFMLPIPKHVARCIPLSQSLCYVFMFIVMCFLCMHMCMCMSLQSTMHHAYESLHSQDAWMGTHQQGKLRSPPTSSHHSTSPPDHVLYSKWNFVFLLKYRNSCTCLEYSHCLFIN